MRLMPLLLPLLLITATVPAFAEDDAPASVFTDQAALDKHLAEACDIVEEIEGQTFKSRPTVRISSSEEVATAIVSEFEKMPESFIAADQREPLAKMVSGLLMAKYEPAKNLVHIVPSAIALIEKAQPNLEKLGEDHLRVLLAHEVTHAMDFVRYDIMGLRAKLTDNDAQQALNAVVEGHAQFIAEEAAKRWKIMPAFERLTAAIVGSPEDEGTDTEKAIRAAALAEIRFAYGQGHDFFRAIAKAGGSEAVDRALREPPARSKMIEQPALWLDPKGAAPEVDLKSIVTSLSWLAPSKGWATQDARVLDAALRSQSLRLPEDRRGEWLKGFKDAHLWQAQDPATGARVVAVLLHFGSEADATLFVELDRIVVEGAKEQPGMTMETLEISDGVGPEKSLPGFFMHRIVKVMGQTLAMRQVVMRHKAFAIEMLVINAKQIERSHLAEGMARIVAWIDDPEAAAKLPALETPKPAKDEPAEDEAPQDEAPKDAEKKAEPEKAPAGAGG